MKYLWDSVSSEATLSRDTPRIGFLVFVVQRFQTLVLLELAELGRVGEFEESWCEFHQPFCVDDRNLTHVLLCRLHQFVVHDPFRLPIEDGAARMNINDLTIYQGAIAFLRVLFGSIAEETGANGFLDPARIFACRDHVQFVPVHNSQQLLTDILGSLQRTNLHEIFVTPSCKETNAC